MTSWQIAMLVIGGAAALGYIANQLTVANQNLNRLIRLLEAIHERQISN